MIKDKFLSKITGKKWFTDEEYPLLREQFKNELALLYTENPPSPPPEKSKFIKPTVNKTKLQAEKTRLEEELNILQTQGFEALQKLREERTIKRRLEEINKQLK